jgi:hypothetical protein
MKSLLFCWIPKTAGTSVYDAFKKAHDMKLYLDAPYNHYSNFDGKGNVSFGHLNLRDLIYEGVVTKEYYDNARVFTFVRNPYDRFRSLWADFKRSNRIHQGTTLWEFAWGMIHLSRKPGLYNALDFSQCASQIDWILPGTEILRFENLQEELMRFGIVSPPHLNQGCTSDWHGAYDKETLKLVTELYLDDFTVLNYDIES